GGRRAAARQRGDRDDPCDPAEPRPPALEDRLTQRRRDELDGERRGAVLAVEDRVHLGDLERAQLSRGGEHLHRQLRLAIREAAAEHQRDRPRALDVGDDAGELLGDADDLLRVVRLLAAHLRELALVYLAEAPRRALVTVGHTHVAAIADRVAEPGEAVAKTGVADRGWSHVHATAVPAQVHGHADDLDGLAHVFAFGWKTARMTPSAARSSPTKVRTF